MMLVGAAFVLPSQAQLLKLNVKDKALQQNLQLVNLKYNDFLPITFDEKGAWSYNNDKVDKPVEITVFMMSKGIFIPVLIEPGKTAIVTFQQKKGDVAVKYAGDNADASKFLYEEVKLSPERLAPRSFDPEDYEDMSEEQIKEIKENIEKQKSDTITFDEAYRRLDQHYASTLKAAKAVKNAERQAEYLHRTELHYLASLINLTQTKAHAWGFNLKNNAYYQELLQRINPNDELGTDQMYSLPQTFIENKLTTDRLDQDQTAYTLDYINNVEKYITNENVRHKLLSELGMIVFNSSYSGQVFEMDKFWPAFKKAAPKRTIDYFQPIYDSRMATKAGQPCPDVSFSDPQGNPHKLSEYFGKVLYIDIWATWCGPCCAEIPHIEKHVAHYKDNPKIQFISISIDSNKQAWHNKLEKDKPEWLQFLCNKQEYELISKQWGITGIPRFVIINADGTINNSEAFRPSAPDFRERIDKIIGE